MKLCLRSTENWDVLEGEKEEYILLSDVVSVFIFSDDFYEVRFSNGLRQFFPLDLFDFHSVMEVEECLE